MNYTNNSSLGNDHRNMFPYDIKPHTHTYKPSNKVNNIGTVHIYSLNYYYEMVFDSPFRL